MAEKILTNQADRSLVSDGKPGLGKTGPWPSEKGGQGSEELMDNVTKFPAEEIRNLAKLENSIRAGVRKAGAPRHLEGSITAELTGLVKKYNEIWRRSSTATLPKGLEKLNEEEVETCSAILDRVVEEGSKNYSEVISEVLSDYLELRLKLYEAKGE